MGNFAEKGAPHRPVSIPTGSIKMQFMSVVGDYILCFNSNWFD